MSFYPNGQEEGLTGNNADPAGAALIVVDWGTSRLRARLVDAHGAPVAEAASEEGIGRIAGGHEEIFERLVGAWPLVPAIIAGMAGSRQGWREAPYLECPTTTDALAGRLIHLRTARGREVAIVPGIMVRSSDRDGDVMRGEETQIVGFVERMPHFAGLCIMPGTHSKWVSLDKGRIVTFQTYMTGELFDLLSHHSFLRHSVAGGDADIVEAPDFALAVRRTAEEGLPFLSAIFSVRARQLLDGVGGAENRAYLSGLIIGAEIGAARESPAPGRDIAIIGSRSLARSYAKAFAILGRRVDRVDGDEMALAGLVHLAREAGLLSPAVVA
jgi:2-dehydro-3-deoxygalactonokinase